MNTATRCITACVIGLMAVQPALASKSDDEFERLATGYINEFPALSPVTATELGDHRYDQLLDEVNVQSLNQRAALYRRYQKQLKKVNFKRLSKANQIDYELLKNDIDSSLWSQDELQEWAWNPVRYAQLAGNAIYSLMARDFAPLEDRLTNAAARLEAMPRLLAQVREIIDVERVPETHAQTAARQNRGLISIMENMIRPELDNISPRLKSRLEAAMETATAAIEEHQQWFNEELVPNAAGEFRIGQKLFDRKLAFTLHSPLSREEIGERAWIEYHRVRSDMYGTARTIYSALYPYSEYPEEADEAYKQAIIRAALEVVYKDLPGRNDIVDVAKGQLDATTAFVREHNIVEVPDDPIEIIIMPEFQRGISVAYCDSPRRHGREQKAQPAADSPVRLPTEPIPKLRAPITVSSSFKSPVL